MVETGFYFDRQASFRRIYNGTNLQIFTSKFEEILLRVHIHTDSQSKNDFSYVTFFYPSTYNKYNNARKIRVYSWLVVRKKKKVEMPFF